MAVVAAADDTIPQLQGIVDGLEEFDATAVATVEDLLALLERLVPDVLIVGPAEGRFVPTDAFAAIRDRFHADELPILWLADTSDEETLARALQDGVNEVVRPPFVTELLVRRLRRCVAIQRIRYLLERTEAQQRRAQTRSEELSANDDLTGLPNRTDFRARVESLLRERLPGGEMLAVFTVDIDRFKMINDGLGLRAGDELLVRFAERLRAAVRSLPGAADSAAEWIGRLGGDCFSVILPTPERFGDVSASARALLEAVQRPYQVGDREIFLTASIGTSIFPTDGTTIDVLVRNSETAMRASKNAGRDTFRFYSESMDTTTGRRFDLENRLRRALDRDELELHYQPIVDATSRTICGVEALLRWRPEPGEWIAPFEFIPLAEQTGLIVPIGEWVLETACKDAAIWNQDARAPLRAAVNLSPRELRKPGFVATVSRILEETGLDPRLLELEITESGVVENDRETLTALHQLKVIGIRLAVDDFGTGHSVLNYLKKFPLDALKIDRSFTRGIMTDADDAAIVRATINMAHGLKMRVIAEGVEEEGQLYFLAQHKCDEAQGYYFGRPGPRERITEILQHGGELPHG